MLMTNDKINLTFVYPGSTAWCCQSCGSVLGHVVTHNHIQYLDMVAERGVKLTGDADVHCLICGSIREWHYGEEAINKLVSRVLKLRGQSG